MRRLLSILVLSGLAACVTPSIPIPPPEPTEMTFHISLTGNVSEAVFTYPATAAYVGGNATLFNRATGQGVLQVANVDGSFGPTLPLPAAAGDNIVVSVENSKQTVSTCIVLREGAQDPTVYCQ
jgi:hypothetical protein